MLISINVVVAARASYRPGFAGYPMSYSVEGYEVRAAECVRLANQAKDALVQKELLTLRQTYLQIAERLRDLREGNADTGR